MLLPGFKQKIMELIPWLVAVYAVICVTAYFGNRLFMYLPDPTRVAPTEAGLESVEEIEIAGSDWRRAGCLACARERKTSRPSFISTATRPTPPIAHPKSKRSARTVSAFSTSTTAVMAARAGEPTEENNVADAIAAHDDPPGLGGGPGRYNCRLSASCVRVGPGGAAGGGRHGRRLSCLEAAATSTRGCRRARSYFWLPLGLLSHRPIQRRAPHRRSVTSPGSRPCTAKQDAVIPVDMGWRIYRAANEPKRIETVSAAAHHYDLFDHGAWDKTAGLSGFAGRGRIARSPGGTAFTGSADKVTHQSFQDRKPLRDAMSAYRLASDLDRDCNQVREVPIADIE